MGTKILDVPSAAGVECLKKTGEMAPDAPCTACIYYSKCVTALAEVFG